MSKHQNIVYKTNLKFEIKYQSEKIPENVMYI